MKEKVETEHTKELSRTQKTWLEIMYKEAWIQIDHESSMLNVKNTSFVTCQGIVLALLTGLSASISKGGETHSNVFGLFCLITALICISLNIYWYGFIKAHRAVSNSRWLVARRIEVELGITDFGLTFQEARWREHRHEQAKRFIWKKRKAFYPYPLISEMENDHIKFSKFTGDPTLYKIVITMSIIWFVIFGIGVYLFLYKN